MKPPILRTQLANGITLLAIENPAVDIVSARMFWLGGGCCDPIDRAGQSYLTAALLTKGSEHHSAAEIARIVESAGALLGTESTPDYVSASLKAVTADFEDMFRLVCSTLRSPQFPETELERERGMIAQAIRSQQERPFTVAYQPIRRALYGDRHPYAESSMGTLETVAKLDREGLFDYHRRYLGPAGLVVAIAGRIDREAIQALVTETLGDWQGETIQPPAALPELPTIESECYLTSEQDTQQSIAMLGYRGPAFGDTDWLPLKLAVAHLGGGLSSRLFVELREKRGLAYEVSASFSPRLQPAPLLAYLGTAPSNLPEALSMLRFEMERLVTQPLSEGELSIAKSKLTGLYALSKQTNSQLAQLLGWYEVLGMGIDYDRYYPEAIASVDSERIQAVAAKYLTHPVISVAGPAVTNVELAPAG